MTLQKEHALKLGQDRGAKRALEDILGEVDTELRQLVGQLDVPFPDDAKAAPQEAAAKAEVPKPVAEPAPSPKTVPAQGEADASDAPTPEASADASPKAAGTSGRPGVSAKPAGDQKAAEFAMPALPPGAPQASPYSRMVMAMERVVPGSTTIATITRKLAGIADVARGIAGSVPIRTGRIAQRAAAGIYKEGPRVVRTWDLLDIPTTAHEVAHALADALHGTAHSRGLAPGLPTNVARELRTLGKNLYGTTKPAAGYIAEGWSELVADWLTTDDIAKRAPAAAAWLEGTVFKQYPEVAKAMADARQEIDVWRGMGAEARLKAQTSEPPGKLARLRNELAKGAGYRSMVESFAPLEWLSKEVTRLTGRKLGAAEDPFMIASARRGTAGAVLSHMVEEGMIDSSGNRVGRGLREALEPAMTGLKSHQVFARKKRAGEFWDYLRARRSIERWAQDKNPGMSLADATYLKQKLERPGFDLAASRYHEWWDGVLNYLAESSPTSKEMVERIRQGSKEYVPLARSLDTLEGKPSEMNRMSSGLRRMFGSSRPVLPVDIQTLRTAESILAKAHREQVLDAIFQLARYEGLGALIEEVPRDRVEKAVNIESIRKELEANGADLTNVPDDVLLTWYQPADRPKGVDPIVARKTSEGVKWYQIPAELYDSLQAIQPSRLKFTADLLFGAPARAFRLGTTGLRAGFALVTNPARDFQTFLIQSATDSSPFQRVTAYFQSLGDIVARGLAGRKSPYLDAFNSLGIQAGNFLGGDVGHAKRAAKGLFHGVLIRRIASPVESLRELLSFTESVPRLAELRLTAKDLAWKPGTPLTPEQAIALTVAAKRVTTDFTASGDVGRAVSQAVPFFNASIQGARAFARTWRERPLQAVLYGLSMFTLPALYTWWSNKDEEWYNALPSRERYLFWNVPDGKGRVIQVPRSLEWQNLFAVIPEALLDAAYRQDPQAIKDAFGHLFASQNPVDYPVLARVLKEQFENRIEFWDRPIVPRAQQDLPPGEQVSPYSSWMARKLGKAFPDTVSPRRVDAALKAYFGGAVPDLIDSLEKIAGVKGFRGVKEAADVPVVGKLFRRGGEFSAASKPLSDFYDHYFFWVKRSKSDARPMTDMQKEDFRTLSTAYREIRTMTKLAEQQTDPIAQRRLYRSITQKAREELESPHGRRLAKQDDR